MPKIPSESVTMSMSMSSGPLPEARNDASIRSGASMARKTALTCWNHRLNSWIASPMVGVYTMGMISSRCSLRRR